MLVDLQFIAAIKHLGLLILFNLWTVILHYFIIAHNLIYSEAP